MNNHTQVECTMNPLRSCLVSVLTLAALGCHGDAVTNPPAIHKAGIHYVNAVPDTMQQDVRIIDIVSNSGLFDANFRTYDLIYNDTLRVVVTAAGTKTPALFTASAPLGVPGTPLVNPIGGAAIPGSVLTALMVPPSVAGSPAPPTFTTPTALYLVDRRPPDTTP